MFDVDEEMSSSSMITIDFEGHKVHQVMVNESKTNVNYMSGKIFIPMSKIK